MFGRSKKTSSGANSPSPTSPTPERIRSKQPFSVIPLEQRRRGEGHVPLDKLLQVYDDYPLLVKDYENLSERFRLAEEETDRVNRHREELQAELDQERAGREEDKIRAREAKEQAERDTNRKVRDELDPKIAELERRLKEMTKERDEYRDELKARTTKMDGWVGQLARLHGESAQQAEREAKAAEERQKVLERSRKLNLEILEGLREISVSPLKSHKANSTAPSSQHGREERKGAEERKSTRTGSAFTEGESRVRGRKFDAADGEWS
jgi:chromosome segregation ATPase